MAPTSLSSFTPANSEYFYGYPAGQDSGFLNTVPPWVEELVSARPLTCAGPDISVISFASAVRNSVRDQLQDLGVPQISDNQIIRLPADITTELAGDARNAAVKNALIERVGKERFIMTQPYADSRLDTAYAISREIQFSINDKQSMADYIPAEFLPPTLATYNNGQDYAGDTNDYTPCVVKVTSSSSGDGVAICKTYNELTQARTKFNDIQTPILIQRYMESRDNLCVQFGIPANAESSIEIIGATKQSISPQGEYLGGIIEDTSVPLSVTTTMLEQVLPRIRAKGWYGIGAIDVLIVDNDEFYCIDPNFRMNASTAFLLLRKNDVVQRNMLTFSGRYSGTENMSKFAETGSENQRLQLVAMSKSIDGYNINGAVVFDQQETLRENARELLARGIQSSAVSSVAQS